MSTARLLITLHATRETQHGPSLAFTRGFILTAIPRTGVRVLPYSMLSRRENSSILKHRTTTANEQGTDDPTDDAMGRQGLKPSRRKGLGDLYQESSEDREELARDPAAEDASEHSEDAEHDSGLHRLLSA